MNAVGLANGGAGELAAKLGSPDFPVIESLAGSDPEEFLTMVKMFDVSGFEINLSCPHSDGLGRHVGDNCALTGRIIEAAMSGGKPVFAKVGVGMVGTAVSALAAGATGIVAINTIQALAYDGMGRPLLGSLECGLSGEAIRLPALRMVHDVSRLCPATIMALVNSGDLITKIYQSQSPDQSIPTIVILGLTAMSGNDV